MRKVILGLLALLLIIPTFVYAEDTNVGISIESIKLIDKSSTANELTPAKAKGTSIDLDISFAKVNDYIKYKLVIKNDTDDDYVLDESMFVKKYDNISYTFETDNKTVKSKSTREIVLNVVYEKAKDFGVYNETNTFDIGLTGGPLENPPTGVYNLLIVIPIILVLGVFLIKNVNSKKVFKAMVILGLIILPTLVYALNKCIIKINSKIFIENCRYKLTTEDGTFEMNKDVKEVCVIDEVFTGYDYPYVWGGEYYPFKTEAYPHLLVYMRTQHWGSVYNLFKDTSYVKVYSDSAKTHLIKTITKKDLPKRYYSINNGEYIDEYMYFNFDGYDDVYFEESSDIADDLETRRGYFDEIYEFNYKDMLFTTNEELLMKIHTLAVTGPMNLFGFHNCDYDNNSCNGNIYKAEFGMPSVK